MDGASLSLFWRLCGVALLAVTVSVALGALPGGLRSYAKIGGTVLLYGGLLALLLPLLEALKGMTEGYALSTHAGLMLKCLGIALAAQIVSDLCRDMGEGTVGSLLETAAKALILLLALPTVEGLLETVKGLLG